MSLIIKNNSLYQMNQSNQQPKPQKGNRRQLELQNQAYQLPIYEKGWSIYLQLLLLDGIEMLGAQNWESIANYLKCEFSADQIRNHYFRVYGDHSFDGLSFLKREALIENQEYDPYGTANNRQFLRKQEERKQKKALEEFKAKKIEKKIPSEFGYQYTKKTFSQSYNQEAQVMLIGLKIQESDSIQMRESKIEVLNLYNKMIQQRAIVQKNVIQQKLMECKYRVNTSNIKIPQNLQNSEAEVKNTKRGRRKVNFDEKKKKKNKRQQFLQKQIIFRIRRTIPQSELSQGLYIAYMKVSKFDEEQRLKTLLKDFNKCCEQLKAEKKKIIDESE